ncbi:sensor domain-containing diguanylate cyclase [Evansella sp. AB-P1]|uniref:sensor domain-containing diguanylate cyclase n=1 Tax=Evansella sp. AB-P1 TaxID=3037653 RepID=UPI0024201211|nr:sensor domain-containing diguanylate cyclase [Evansella sp. AB-P1]MDG5789373.1 sensor domain-containing diguanylate cyclase [Evansella sp. AB-P1]
MIYSRNRQSARHITCSLLYVCTAMWFVGVFASLVNYPLYFNEISLYWVNGTITIGALLSLHLWFMNGDVYKKKNGKYLKLIFVPGIVMLLTFPIDSWMIRGDGNALNPMFIPGPGLYLLWGIDFAYLAIIIILTIIEMKKGNSAAKLWLKGILLYFIWTTFMLMASIVLESSSYNFFFYLIPHGSLFWAFAIFLSMSRFDYLSSYEKRYNILFQRSPSGILIMDEQGVVLEASPQISKYLGVEREKVVQSPVISFLYGIDKEKFYNKYNMVFEEQIKVENLELSFVNKIGERKTILIDSDFILVEGKRFLFVMLKDITDAKTKEERVQYLAYHDILTGLPNRAAFEKQIDYLLDNEIEFNLLLLDLNKLKSINDTFGHQAGDHAIQHVATILQGVISDKHHAARLGGDEFVLLLGVKETEVIIKTIQQQLTKPLKLTTKHEIRLSASIGVSHYPSDGQTMDQLYSVADKRMYVDKKGVL